MYALILSCNTCLSLVFIAFVHMRSTKQVSRFHTPFVLGSIKLLAQHQDQFRIKAQKTWKEFLVLVCVKAAHVTECTGVEGI